VRVTWSLILALALLVPALEGCRKRVGRAGDEAGRAGAGLDEDALAGGSSLERARRGLGPEEGGILADVHFGYDSYEVDASGREALERNLAWLRDNPRAKIELEGHADSRGTIEYNLALGAKRAKAVKDHLTGRGVGAERLSTISYGEELPLCQEEHDSCWARNRRVHAVILNK
jgi:peptidoglycan-associated lipoprotein